VLRVALPRAGASTSAVGPALDLHGGLRYHLPFGAPYVKGATGISVHRHTLACENRIWDRELYGGSPIFLCFAIDRPVKTWFGIGSCMGVSDFSLLRHRPACVNMARDRELYGTGPGFLCLALDLPVETWFGIGSCMGGVRDFLCTAIDQPVITQHG